MERDVVAPERTIKTPIPAAPINRDLRQDLSSRSGEFKFKRSTLFGYTHGRKAGLLQTRTLLR